MKSQTLKSITIYEFQNLTDEELVNKIVQTKNILVFEILYDRYELIIYNKYFDFVNDDRQASKLTQDFFLTLFSELGNYRGPYKFSAWLYYNAYQLCINHFNIKSKKVEIIDLAKDNYLHIQMNDTTLFKMNWQILKKAIVAIPIEDRALLLLHYQDDISIKELELLMQVSNEVTIKKLKIAKAHIVESYNKLL